MSKVTPETALAFNPADGKQLSELSRDSLVRMVEQQAQQGSTPLGRRVRSSPHRKQGSEMVKRSKHIEYPNDSSTKKEGSLAHIFQHNTPKTVFVPHQNYRRIQPDKVPVTITSHTPSSYKGNIIPPSQRVDTGMDELLSAKSGGTDSTPPSFTSAPSLISCPPPVTYHRRVALSNNHGQPQHHPYPHHHRTSYRSLTSNTSSTAAELECLVSVATPPGLLRNTTSSSARWESSSSGRPSNPVPMQVDAGVTRQESGASGITLGSTSVGAAVVVPSWTQASPKSGFAPYQPAYRHG